MHRRMHTHTIVILIMFTKYLQLYEKNSLQRRNAIKINKLHYKTYKKYYTNILLNNCFMNNTHINFQYN
jgi:vacuolar-type H+-ATPase subunit C/Vma6